MSTLHWSATGLEVHKVVVGPVDNNVFVIRCTETGEGVLLDAANEHDRLLELCQALNVQTVLETHGHWDHIQAIPEIRDAGYNVGVTAADADMLPSYDYIIEDDSVIAIGNLRIRTLATPGHTPGSICYHIENTPLLFSGDTLFPGGPGNTTFPGADFTEIIKSIEDRIFAKFGGDTLVLPGHGDDTTVGAESPNLQAWVDRGW